MQVHIHIHHSWDEAPQEIRDMLSLITEKLEDIMSALDDLQAAVTAEDTVIDSAITLIKGIPALIAAAGVDPAKLAALQSDITANAVQLNTPASAPVTQSPATPTAT